MAIFPADIPEVISTTKLLKSNASKGYDDISPYICKKIISTIASPLCSIINQSFNTGVFPDELKIARVVPIHKAGDKLLVTNYRPISILPFFSKIFEKLMHNRLMKYLDTNDILTNNQYGFRNKSSTHLALLNLTDIITKELENNNFSIGVFIDLSKAFDTINHTILLQKLGRYGIRGTILDWFHSYLNNRTQYVNINDSNSDPLPVTVGVPQGSILGPLLFIIYINDIVNVFALMNTIMFADDTNLFFSNKDLSILFKTVNNELEKIAKWFKCNRLSLNLDKTSYIIFTTRNKKIIDTNLDIKIDGITLELVQKTKFLGVIINSHLNWKDHIQLVQSKISKNIGILYKISSKLPINILKSLYFTLIQPYYQYCNIVWATGKSLALDSLFRTQKKVIRIISKKNRLAHTDPLFKSLSILKLSDINHLQVGCFVYKSINKQLPRQFNNFFTINSTIHNHNTRQAYKLHRMSYRIHIRENSICIFGARFWNTLEVDLINSVSFQIFKNKLKKRLLQAYL